MHCLPSTPSKCSNISPSHSPISPINHRQSGTHAGDTPAQTPTRLPSHKGICPNDGLACQAPRATKTQAATYSAPFTGPHPTAAPMQPKRSCHKQKTPITVRRSSISCSHRCHSCPTANCRAKPNALAESTRQPRKPVHLHYIHWQPTPNQQCHLTYIMHPSNIVQCPPPQSHNLGETSLRAHTDN